MTYTPLLAPPQVAALSQYRVARSPIFYGETLEEIKCLERAIARFGLLTPLCVMPVNQTLLIIEGKKRFAALRRMQAKGTLPQDLRQIPYIVLKTDSARPSRLNAPCRTRPHARASIPKLSHNREQYQQVRQLWKAGHTPVDIATSLYISKACVSEILSVTHLSPQLKSSYFEGHLTRSQAKALATLADHGLQNAVRSFLGPFAQDTEILHTIARMPAALRSEFENNVAQPMETDSMATYPIETSRPPLKRAA